MVNKLGGPVLLQEDEARALLEILDGAVRAERTDIIDRVWLLRMRAVLRDRLRQRSFDYAEESQTKAAIGDFFDFIESPTGAEFIYRMEAGEVCARHVREVLRKFKGVPFRIVYGLALRLYEPFSGEGVAP